MRVDDFLTVFNVLLSINPIWLKAKSSLEMPSARAWLSLKQKIERTISAILIANTLANTGLVTVSGAMSLRIFGAKWLWVFSLVLSFTMVVFGELFPKIPGVRRPAELAPKLLPPLQFTMKVFGPVALAAQYVCEKVTPGQRPKVLNDSHIMDTITLTRAAQSENAIHNREEIIIIHAATLSARRVGRSMIPAETVKVFNSGFSSLENLAAMGSLVPRACPVSDDGILEQVSG